MNDSPTTNVVFSSAAREKLYEGIKIAAEAVSCTLGPRGKSVLIQREGSAPIVTKDGVSVSKAIKLRDPILRMGAELVQEAASRTNDMAGDGTTTATVLTYAMIKEGMKLLAGGYDATQVCKGISIASQEIIRHLRTNAKLLTTMDEITQIGTISANGDREVGELIAKAMSKVGQDGIITVEDAKGMVTSLDIVEGMQLDRGYVSPYFVTNNERMHASYSDALVLITDKKLTSMQELIPVLEKVVNSQRSLLIIADEIEGEALQGLVVNRVKSNLQVVAIRSPGYGTHRVELLNDICKLTGANLVSASTGLSLDKVALTDLGNCKKITVDAKSTILVGNSSAQNKKNLEEHLSDLHNQLSDVTLAQDELVKLKTRIAKLVGGIAVLRVGGATELEMIERKYRIEDALHATRAAADEGILPGGGIALFNAASTITSKFTRNNYEPDVLEGISLVLRSCSAPLCKIIKNAGKSPEVVSAELKKNYDADALNTMGYDASRNEMVNMFQSGIIDPVKVTRYAVEHAASVAVTFMTLDAVIYDEEKK